MWDFLGFPTELVYTPAGADVYFDRTDTETAMHSPQYVDWAIFGGLWWIAGDYGHVAL